MPCAELKELEASCHRYAECRHRVSQQATERRNQLTDARRVGQFRMAYMIRVHRQNCDVCRCDE
jgi:hypothetical protein